MHQERSEQTPLFPVSFLGVMSANRVDALVDRAGASPRLALSGSKTERLKEYMTTTLETTQQLVDAGSKEIADLEAHIADITDSLDQARAELADLAQARQDRAQQLQAARAPVAQAEQALIHASNRAKWAQGTPTEAEAVKDVSAAKETLSAARNQYDQQRSEGEQADQAATVRETELRKQMDAALVQLQETQSQLTALQSTHKLTHAELGELKHAALTHAYQEKARQVEELRNALLSAQVAAHDFHSEALHDLAQWPEHARAFKQLAPTDDPLLRIIDMSLHLLETIRANAEHAPYEVRSPEFVLHGGVEVYPRLNVWDKLLIQFGEVRDVIRKQMDAIDARKQGMLKLRDTYLAYLKTQEEK